MTFRTDDDVPVAPASAAGGKVVRDDEIVGWLRELGKQCEFDPDIPIELSGWLDAFIATYTGERSGLREWLRTELPGHFVSVDKAPSWIHGAEWPVCDGAPMVFLSQTEVVRGTFADVGHDVVFYLFWSARSGSTVVVQQLD